MIKARGYLCFFFFQAEDGIRDGTVTGVQTCALPILAKVAGAEQGIGVARFVRLRDDPFTAEIALAVVDAHQRKGIGRLLLRRLTEAASERGLRQLLCFVLPENVPMTALVRQLAPEAKQDLSESHGAAFSTLVFRVPLRSQASA